MNDEFLEHRNHKYIDRYKGRAGKWVYVYADKGQKAVNDLLTNVKKTAGYKLKPKYPSIDSITKTINSKKLYNINKFKPIGNTGPRIITKKGPHKLPSTIKNDGPRINGKGYQVNKKAIDESIKKMNKKVKDNNLSYQNKIGPSPKYPSTAIVNNRIEKNKLYNKKNQFTKKAYPSFDDVNNKVKDNQLHNKNILNNTSKTKRSVPNINKINKRIESDRLYKKSGIDSKRAYPSPDYINEKIDRNRLHNKNKQKSNNNVVKKNDIKKVYPDVNTITRGMDLDRLYNYDYKDLGKQVTRRIRKDHDARLEKARKEKNKKRIMQNIHDGYHTIRGINKRLDFAGVPHPVVTYKKIKKKKK